MAGIVMARLFAASEWPARALSTPGRWMLGGCGATVALLLIAALLQVAASDRLFRKGEAQRKEFDFDGAAISYQRALRVDPAYWRPYLGMGDLLRRQSFWNRDPDDKKSQADEAIRYYRAAARRNPWDEDPIFGISKIYQNLGDLGQAVVLLQGIVEKEPRQAFYLTELGKRLSQAGRYAEALAAFEEAQKVEYSGLAARNILWLKEKLAAPAP
jgi:tetratricopeptide (TPR) repeat protein